MSVVFSRLNFPELKRKTHNLYPFNKQLKKKRTDILLEGCKKKRNLNFLLFLLGKLHSQNYRKGSNFAMFTFHSNHFRLKTVLFFFFEVSVRKTKVLNALYINTKFKDENCSSNNYGYGLSKGCMLKRE